MGNNVLIDLEHLDMYVSGDTALRDEVLGIFVQQADIWIGMLDPMADDAAWKDAAHALKGASRGVGAWEVGDICEQAEKLVGEHNDDPELRYQILRELRNKVHQTVSVVRALRDRSEQE